MRQAPPATLADCPQGVRSVCRSCRWIVILPARPLIERFGPGRALSDLPLACKRCGSTECEASPYHASLPGIAVRHSEKG